ncbi:V-set and immunoglobulin domain-containing protein 1-like isoform X1 [Helicoverpa zea]|uniref:V-set and immunoglobulin domain-containing protein 1-like isoform X1 n=1 Tax=Helicoverpa zea TaxID=7113 RepID=UPI001F57E81F|nr:V-set and immunoglobulin domain-containing protein 1-like isoform X1 [Helicoverpa zea]
MSARAACSLLLCLVAGSLQLSIKEFVVPKAVEVGQDAELLCQYELGENETEVALYVKWWWTPQSGSSYDRKQIYQRIAGQAAEAIHHDNTSQIEIRNDDTIVLLDVNPVDSGTYECEVSNIEEIRNHEKLIVFSMGTGPEINYTLIEGDNDVEEDMLLIECKAENVAPSPDMAIIFQGGKIDISKNVEDVNQDGLYDISGNATVSAKDIDEGEIRCELFYTTLDHPPYVDVETYIRPGRDAPPTAQPAQNATEPEPTHESLQNSSDDAGRVHSTWTLLLFAGAATYLQATQTFRL